MNSIKNIQVAFMGPSFEKSLPIISECISSINTMIREKGGSDALQVIPSESPKGIRCLYKKVNPSNMLSDFVIKDQDDWKSKITMFQDFVFNACKAYGLFETIKMRGDATRGDQAAFDIATEKEQKTYVLWEKPTVENTVERFLEFLTTYEVVSRNPVRAGKNSLYTTFSCPREYAGAYKNILASFNFKGEQFNKIVANESKVSDTFGLFKPEELYHLNVSFVCGYFLRYSRICF